MGLRSVVCGMDKHSSGAASNAHVRLQLFLSDEVLKVDQKNQIAVEQEFLALAYAETDAANGVEDDIKEHWRYEGDKLVCERTQDVQPYLDFNKARLNEAPTWRPFSGVNSRVVADIPCILVEKWMKEGFNLLDDKQEGYQRKLREKLNSNEFQALRVTPGKI